MKGLYEKDNGGVNLEDKQIVDLYWERCEQAIAETDKKYGRLCWSIAGNILDSREDCEESVNDTYLAAWNAMPPHRPALLMSFLAKLSRRIAIKRWRSIHACKRGGGQVPLALEELTQCASGAPDVEAAVVSREAYAALNRFLATLPEVERNVFLRRYFLLDTAAQIGENFGFTESKVNSMLHRTRVKLKTHLTKEGYL